MRILGIILIAAGILAMTLPYVTFTKREKVLDIGPIEAAREQKERVPISPFVGLGVLVAGTVIVVYGMRKRD